MQMLQHELSAKREGILSLMPFLDHVAPNLVRARRTSCVASAQPSSDWKYLVILQCGGLSVWCCFSAVMLQCGDASVGGLSVWWSLSVVMLQCGGLSVW